MSDVLIEQDTMEDIGDSIRSKLGVQTTYLPSEMPNAIMSISGGGNEMELTKAEYDALSEAEKTNGTTYYITDAQSWTSKEVQPVIYSTDEREIGVWTDGKPLYQKTFIFDNVTTLNSWMSTNHNISNIDKIIDYNAIFTRTSDNWTAIADHFEGSSTAYISSNADKTQIHFKIAISIGTYNVSYTIRYTKTTDQAGSGIYTPQGQLAVHYSTEEHVIGTWIDGKTIYEKTLTGLNISATTAWGTQITLISNIDTIIDIKTRDQYGPRAASCQRLDANTFNFKLESGTATIIILTLRYTKTTD